MTETAAERDARHAMENLPVEDRNWFIQPMSWEESTRTVLAGSPYKHSVVGAFATAEIAERIVREHNAALDDRRALAAELAEAMNAAPMGADLPHDVVRLVVAARMVAYSDPDPDALKELDQAAEAFASRVRWCNEPVTDRSYATQPVEDLAPAALFGQRLCACGYANHDLRKQCRSCGSDLPRPSGAASALSQTLGEAAPAADVSADSPLASAAKLKDGLPSGLAGGPE